MAKPSNPDPNAIPPGGASANGSASNSAGPGAAAQTPNPPPSTIASVASTAPLSQEERRARSRRLASRLEKSSKRLAERKSEIAEHRRWLYNSPNPSSTPRSALKGKLRAKASGSPGDRSPATSLSASPAVAPAGDTTGSPDEMDGVSTNLANSSQPAPPNPLLGPAAAPVVNTTVSQTEMDGVLTTLANPLQLAGTNPLPDYCNPALTEHDGSEHGSEEESDEEALFEPEPGEELVFDYMVSPFAGDATVPNRFSLFERHQSLATRLETALTIRNRPQDTSELPSTDTITTVAPGYGDKETFAAFKQMESIDLDHQIKILEDLKHSWESACMFAGDRLDIKFREVGPDTSDLADAMTAIVNHARGAIEEVIDLTREYQSERLQCYDRWSRELAARSSQSNFREGKVALFNDVLRLTEKFRQNIDKMKSQFIRYGKEWVKSRPLCYKVLQMDCWKDLSITQMVFDTPSKDIFADPKAWTAAHDAEYMLMLEVEACEDVTYGPGCFKHSCARVFPQDYTIPAPIEEADAMQIETLQAPTQRQLALTASQDAVNEGA